MQPADTQAPANVPNSIQPCEIYVDEEGDWYHRGSRIIREDIIEIFMRNLRMDRDGSHLIQWNQTLCALDAADTVHVVGSVERTRPGDAEQEQIELALRHLLLPEVLDPDTLWVGKDNVLYCRVREGKFPARFSRPAYYQLTQWVQEDLESGEFYIELNGRRFAIRTGGQTGLDD